jgi:glycosyltransferase involved in cell wall biosynthesis
VSELVVPLGPRSDIPNIARAFDLHVLASCGGEAFPNVVAETMLSQTPNVVTDVGDSAFMVGGSGWVVPPRDPQRLADAIIAAHREWEDDVGRWQARRAAARERIERNFSIDAMARAYEDVWRRVAGAGSLSDVAAR